MSPTQKRILTLLSDSQVHTREELQACLWDKLGSPMNIHYHITCLRKRLRSRDQEIVCKEKTYYQWVVLAEISAEKAKDTMVDLFNPK